MINVRTPGCHKQLPWKGIVSIRTVYLYIYIFTIHKNSDDLRMVYGIGFTMVYHINGGSRGLVGINDDWDSWWWMRIYPLVMTVLYGKINTFDWFKDHRSEWAMASIAAMRLYELLEGKCSWMVFCIILLSRVVGKACSDPWSTNSEVGHWIFHPNQLQETKNCESERSTVFGKNMENRYYQRYNMIYPLVN